MKTLLIALFLAASAQAQTTNRWVTHPATPTTELSTLLQYPEEEARAKHEMEVAFFCEVDENGKVGGFQLYRPTDSNNVFVVAVRKAITSATFAPAVSAGETVPVQLGATALFKIKNGWPTAKVILNTSDSSATERDYTGPQLIGGHATLLHNVNYPDIARSQHKDGVVDLAFEIDIFGGPRSVKVVSETPTGFGFGESAVAAVRKARFIPALYKNNALKAPSSQRIEFNLELINRYAPIPASKKKS